jgi:poly-gamma-glutamate synthesis protein (capsule biosynthesis protein)
MMKYLLTVLVKLIGFFSFGRWRYSRQVEGNALFMSVGEKVWWAYKFYGNPVREPERGKNIREHFRDHSIEGFGRIDETAFQGKDLPSCTIRFAGDILPCPDYIGALTGYRKDAIGFFEEGDICYANLESPVVATRPISPPPDDITSPPDMNNNPEAIDYLLQGARDTDNIVVFSTANNHSLDQGIEGVGATLEVLDERNIPHVGTARSIREQDALLMVESRGFKITFLSWTFGLNSHSLPEGQGYLVNVLRLNLPGIDISPIAAQVQEARRRGADAVVLCLHWGLEYECFPLASQIETGHRLAECGVDVIVGNHPHILQPAERHVWRQRLDGKDITRESLIIYALGDFLSPWPHLDEGPYSALMEATFVRQEDGLVVIRDVRREEF